MHNEVNKRESWETVTRVNTAQRFDKELLRALDKLEPNGRTDARTNIVTPWAPDGAKNEFVNLQNCSNQKFYVTCFALYPYQQHICHLQHIDLFIHHKVQGSYIVSYYCRRSDDDVFLESWSDYSPEDDYEDSYIETPIDYMEVRKYHPWLWILFCHDSLEKIWNYILIHRSSSY